MKQNTAFTCALIASFVCFLHANDESASGVQSHEKHIQTTAPFPNHWDSNSWEPHRAEQFFQESGQKQRTLTRPVKTLTKLLVPVKRYLKEQPRK